MLIFLLFLVVPYFCVSNGSQYNREKTECLISFDENHEAIFQTPFGSLEGLNFTVGTSAQPFHSKAALGIAYAYNSIGEFRFRRPITMPSFSLLSAKRFERHCIPGKDYPGMKEFNEDCLFLNIFMPFEVVAGSEMAFPVLFFIHGGMYNYGASDDLPLTAIIKNFVSRGIAVVTANYRLGPLGFFQDPSVPSNIGLRDLEKAFEFILLSAEKLHLNPRRITLGGVEGGAVLAELLALRHGIRDNITSVLLVGGSVMTPWAFSPTVGESSLNLAQNLNIKIENNRNIVNGIKRIDSWEIIGKHQEKNGDLGVDARAFVEFTPDFDPEYFSYPSLKKALFEARPIPIYIITTKNEGSIRTSTFDHNFNGVFNEKTGIHRSNHSKFSCNDFEIFVRKFFASGQSDEIIAEYACLHSKTQTPFEVYNDMIGDFWFKIPAAFSAMLYAELDHPVYVTVVNTSDAGFERLTGQKAMSSIVMSEAYLFSDENPYNIGGTKEEKTLFKSTQNLIADSVVNFVKTNYSHLKAVGSHAYEKQNFVFHEIENGAQKIEEKQKFSKKLPFWRIFLVKHGFGILNPRLDDGHDLFFFPS